MSWRDARGVLKDVLPQDLKSEEILWCQHNEWSYDDYRAMKRVGVDPRKYESPLAAMRDALLSDKAVEAAAKGLWDAESDGNPVREWQGGVTDAHPGMARCYRDQARAALTAALDVMTDAERKKEEHNTISKAKMVEVKRAYREARGLS